MNSNEGGVMRGVDSVLEKGKEILEKEYPIRRDAKVDELTGIFRRSYEMSRAYGRKSDQAEHTAKREVDGIIGNEWKERGSDKKLLAECRKIVVGKVKYIVELIEKGAV